MTIRDSVSDYTSSRLDKYIKRKYGSHIPQSMIEKAIRNKDILVNGAKATASAKVSDGDNVFVKPVIERKFAQLFCDNQDKIYQKNALKNDKDWSRYIDKFKSMIIYEDDFVIIINKPSGLAMQLGTKTNIAVDVMAKAYNPEARIVHRLDKDTSGISIIAKDIKIARWLMRQFQCKNIQKQYYAVVTPQIQASVGDEITIRRPISREDYGPRIDFENGKDATTVVKVIRHMQKNRTLVVASPKTGRMHQIRVHLASLGHYIVGDKKYSPEYERINRNKVFMLHAWSVRFKMPDGKEVCIKSDPPGWAL